MYDTAQARPDAGPAARPWDDEVELPPTARLTGAPLAGLTGSGPSILWVHVLGVGLMHAGALVAPFYFSWGGVGVAVLFWWLAGGLGICLGYHRLLAHRAFKAPRRLSLLLAVLGTLSWQGSPVAWVGKHRLHHRDADGPLDPHSPRHSFAWGHLLWVFVRAPVDAREAARDLQRDPFMHRLDRWHALPQLLLALALYTMGELWRGEGLSWLLWGVPLRTVFGYHATWCVNSICHRWGYRSYDTPDLSRNNPLVALLTFGEGWHNNHHAIPRAAAHGRHRLEPDLTYLTICLLERLGLATDVVRPARQRPALGHAIAPIPPTSERQDPSSDNPSRPNQGGNAGRPR